MKIKKKILLIFIVYIIILLLSVVAMVRLNRSLMIKRYNYDSLTATQFVDDFIRIGFTCQDSGMRYVDADLIVFDEYGNVWHNSSHELSCSRLYNIDLQSTPWDFAPGREYIVYAYYNNKSINSGYFSFKDLSGLENIKLRIRSYFSFMIFQNHMALGTYCDQQRLLWFSTQQQKYGSEYLKCQRVQVLFLFCVVLTINVLLWILYYINQGRIILQKKISRKKL